MAPPVWIEMKELAELIGWETRKTRDFCRRLGVAVKRGPLYYTTLDRLRESAPEAAEEIARRLEAKHVDAPRQT